MNQVYWLEYFGKQRLLENVTELTVWTLTMGKEVVDNIDKLTHSFSLFVKNQMDTSLIWL